MNDNPPVIAVTSFSKSTVISEDSELRYYSLLSLTLKTWTQEKNGTGELHC